MTVTKKQSLENRSLDRGITVLECLAQGGAMSLHQLHQATGLAKSTLRRLLSTLVARRIIRVGLGDKLYRTNIALPDLSPVTLSPRAARLVDAAMPHMIELTRKIGWPSDLHLFDGDHMRVVESTRALSPYHIYKGSIDIGVSVFGSAGGRAFLSALPHDELERIVMRIGDHPEFGLKRLNLNQATLDKALQTVRGRGYAIRDMHYPPVTTRDDRLQVIAVPLYSEARSVGALTLMWARGYLDHEEFAANYLSDLRATSQRISESLSSAIGCDR